MGSRRTGACEHGSVTITVRRPTFDLADLPRTWIGGSWLATQYGNAGHVFIPVGEAFFIDTVKGFRDAVADPALRRDVNAFIGQESVHQRAHEELWDLLRERGVPVDRYVRFIEVVRSVERFVPPVLRLSTTAALEHYTAAFGFSFLTEDLGSAVPPEMARLLAWHGLEELEHRSVAFDVLAAVDDRYVTRVAGFLLGSGMLAVVPLVGTALFAVADLRHGGRPGGAAPNPDLRAITGRFLRRMGGHVADYLRPGFHPAHLVVPSDLGDEKSRLG